MALPSPVEVLRRGWSRLGRVVLSVLGFRVASAGVAKVADVPAVVARGKIGKGKGMRFLERVSVALSPSAAYWNFYSRKIAEGRGCLEGKSCSLGKGGGGEERNCGEERCSCVQERRNGKPGFVEYRVRNGDIHGGGQWRSPEEVQVGTENTW
jgi:hypothetical protein